MKKEVEHRQYCGSLSRMSEQFHGAVSLLGFLCGGRGEGGEWGWVVACSTKIFSLCVLENVCVVWGGGGRT